eukprot:c18877_g1_i1 orf=2-511(+)
MIDLLGRAGKLDEAEDLVNNMPFGPCTVAWMSLLSACRIHGGVERGSHVADCAFELDPTDSAPFVLLSNIYAAAGRLDDVALVRKAMKDRGAKKVAGISCIEVDNRVHEFIAGDISHSQKDEIYTELRRLSRDMEEAGYVPEIKAVLHDVQEKKKEHVLFYHSEKLAIA